MNAIAGKIVSVVGEALAMLPDDELVHPSDRKPMHLSFEKLDEKMSEYMSGAKTMTVPHVMRFQI